MQGRNLGSPVTLTYDPSRLVQMPKIRDASGAVVPGMECTHYSSSNTGVLRELPLSQTQDANDWRTVGVGETTVTCLDNVADGVLPVQVTVVGADPALQGFAPIHFGMDSDPYPLVPPASLNPSGAWSYSVVGSADPVVAEIVDGKIVPRAAGQVTIRATQAAAANYREASIDTTVEVDEAGARTFDDIVATYLDPSFAVPRPSGIAADVPVTYTIDAAKVARIVAGDKIQINGAGVTTITAHWREGSLDQWRTGTLTVKKAVPRLVFSFPKRKYKVSVCGSEWTWPVADQGTSNDVGGILTTNSDGALYYPMGFTPGWGNEKGPEPGRPYYLRYMTTGAYTEDAAVWEDAWVEQAESENFLAARSPTVSYALWGDDRVFWNGTRWIDSCGG